MQRSKADRLTCFLEPKSLWLCSGTWRFTIIPTGVSEVQENRHIEMDSTDQKIRIQKASSSAEWGTKLQNLHVLARKMWKFKCKRHINTYSLIRDGKEEKALGWIILILFQAKSLQEKWVENYIPAEWIWKFSYTWLGCLNIKKVLITCKYFQ